MENGRQEQEEERDITSSTSCPPPGAHSGPLAERQQPSPPLLAYIGTGPEVRISPV